MNKFQNVSIRSFRSDLYDDIDRCNELKRSYDFDLDFPKLMIITVKLKIINDFLDIFNLIIKKQTSGAAKYRLQESDKLHCLNLMKRITKRVKIHIAQLKKFAITRNDLKSIRIYETSEIYYQKLLKAVYKCILC